MTQTTGGHDPASPSSLSPPALNLPHLYGAGASSGSSSSNHARQVPISALAGPSSRPISGSPADGSGVAERTPMYPGLTPELDRGEFVRLSIQALRDCGYLEAAQTLERESGYAFELAPVGDLRSAVQGGRWEEASALLDAVGITGTRHATKARFLIEEQRYLELLETGQSKKALVALRTGLAPLAFDPERLHRLSSLMLCITRDELFARSSWTGAAGTSRSLLLTELESFIPPSLCLPPRRLHTLLGQSLAHQRAQAKYLVTPRGQATLFRDEEGERASFPLRVAAQFSDARDLDGGGEVWNLAWSPDGRLLAAVGTGRTVFIYKVAPRDETTGNRDISLETALHDAHKYSISNVCWSPDSRQLVTTAEEQIRLWDVQPWKVKASITEHTELVSTARWLPDGSGFMTSGEDGKFCHFSRDGHLLSVQQDITGLRLFDFDFSPDGVHLLGAATFAREANPLNGLGRATYAAAAGGMAAGDGGSGGYKAASYRLVVMELRASSGRRLVDGDFPTLPGELTGFKLSHDGQTALISRNPHEIQLWSFTGPNNEPKLVRRLHGHTQVQYYVRACFAGPDDNLVLSGSEDSNIYVWHRHSGELLEVLRGHTEGAVNAVAWRPDVVGDESALFASAGDDGTVIFWDQAPLDQPLPERDLSGAKQPLSGALL